MTGPIEFDQVDPQLIASRHGTPAFVLSRRVLRDRLDMFSRAMRGSWANVRFFYSIKANPNPWVLREALSRDWGLDVCSRGDLWLARQVAADRQLLSFAGVGVSRQELTGACEEAGYVNVCTPAQVDQVRARTARLGIRLTVGPNRTGIAYTTNKFGLTAGETIDAIQALEAGGARVRGLHCHAGSGIAEPDDLIQTLSCSLLDAIDLLGNRARSRLEYVNIGGGLGLAYDDHGGGMDPVCLAAAAAKLMGTLSDRVGHQLELHCEPGEWVVGPAGALITRVTNVFFRGRTRVAIVDASLNQYMGTSFSRPNNMISVRPARNEALIPHDVFGGTNSPGDVFCRGRFLPRLEEGDLIILHCAGAYGYSRGGRFNEHLQAPEVWVDGNRFALAREREPLMVLQQHVPATLTWSE